MKYLARLHLRDSEPLEWETDTRPAIPSPGISYVVPQSALPAGTLAWILPDQILKFELIDLEIFRTAAEEAAQRDPLNDEWNRRKEAAFDEGDEFFYSDEADVIRGQIDPERASAIREALLAEATAPIEVPEGTKVIRSEADRDEFLQEVAANGKTGEAVLAQVTDDSAEGNPSAAQIEALHADNA